jgi:hypothetical protein
LAFGGTFSRTDNFVDLHATNVAGTDDKTVIQSIPRQWRRSSPALQVNGKVGVDFNYALTATGQPCPRSPSTISPLESPSTVSLKRQVHNVRSILHRPARHELAGFRQQNLDRQRLARRRCAQHHQFPSMQLFTFTPFVYNLTATGTAPITYSFDNLPRESRPTALC